MSSVDETRTAIERLPMRELTRFRRWFVQHDAAVWDRQIEDDVAVGRLEGLGRAALGEHRAQRTKPLGHPTQAPGFGAPTERCQRKSGIGKRNHGSRHDRVAIEALSLAL